MNEKNTNFFEEEESIDIKKVVSKYLRYWPWFMLSILICLGIASAYLYYADFIYVTQAKVRILDESENNDLSLDISKLLSKSRVNLENEIAAFNSIRLAEKVAQQLDLNIAYIVTGDVKSTREYRPPFKIKPLFNVDSLPAPLGFGVTITPNGYEIRQEDKPGIVLSGSPYYFFSIQELPLQLVDIDSTVIKAYENINFDVIISPILDTALELSKAKTVGLEGKDSDILQIKMESRDRLHAREVINTFIEAYAKDGVFDRQEISRRTIEFVDERFRYLQLELDSVELSKSKFKEQNSLSFIEGDVQASIQIKVAEDKEVQAIETQLLLAQLLQEALNQETVKRLLPSGLGINNTAVNQLIGEYNTLYLEFEKLSASAGQNNPTFKIIADELDDVRENIDVSIASYVNQLEESLKRAQTRLEKAQGNFSDLPEKELLLRNIERQQNLKESLYLLLLQKREEAAINLAITVPNIKVIDYAITQKTPIAPMKSIIVFGAVGLGFLIPFVWLYLTFIFNTKINSREDIESAHLDIPILGEIPFMESKTIITNANDRSVISEAFQITGSNINYKLGQSNSNRAKVILVTSSMKGEGKTFVTLNLALSYAFLNKRVLLIGADLRNPQIHKYFDLKKSEIGVSDYLKATDIQWTDCILKPINASQNFDLMIAGSPTLNPGMLLASSKFDTLIQDVVGQYDYVVVDSAPTLLVSDTQMIAKNADITIQVMRAGVTDKSILEYARSLKKEGKLNNMSFVLNAVGEGSAHGYNYGYGYGYSEESVKVKPWFKRFSK